MACIRYIPTKNVIIPHANAYANGSQVELCFDITTPSITVEENKNIQYSLSGRPCITSLNQKLTVTLDAPAVLISQKPQWVEFFASTRCGEEFFVDTKSLPSSCWGAGDTVIRESSPDIEVINKMYFSISFSVVYWDLSNGIF